MGYDIYKNTGLLFFDKRVALVGPAPHILDSVQDLSGYDFVCRVNGSIPLSEEMILCTGNRCDVWYPANRMLKVDGNLCLLDEIKIIRTTKKGAVHIPKKAHHKLNLCTSNFSELKRAVNCVPNRGLKAMVDILSETPKELYITGFTFYQFGSYYDGYVSDKDRDHQSKKGGNVGNHKQEPQMEYFKSKILPFVKVDSKLKEMFKC